jgi:hypothetical protein
MSKAWYGKKMETSEEKISPLVTKFLLGPITPEATLEFEQELQKVIRELGRDVMEWTFNAAEPEDADDQPHDAKVEGGGYRRLRDKTPNRDVATTFGRITLWRRGYRSWSRDDGESLIFPLERQLGLVVKVTPALAGRIARRMAEAGATQGTVIDWLRQEHDVAIGVERLRQLCEQVSSSLEEQRESHQIQYLLELLAQAQASSGRNRPVLAVGRDGVTFHVQGVYEFGSTGTVSVYNRSGRRLGTVYLAQPSEAYQTTLSVQLTSLVLKTLAAWTGPLPRLCYVTDAGDAETQYYDDVLQRMRDPNKPWQTLEWIRIVDYFHVSERIATMAQALRFDSERDSHAWMIRMRKLLKKPGGAGRVLRSAAAMRSRLGLHKSRQAEFRRACNYLRNQRRYIDYADYKRLGLPIGSGVTEAACKTVFTQRLKLSGMQWKRGGAQTILRLRIVLLSGIWDQAYKASVRSNTSCHIEVYGKNTRTGSRIAA